jgi:hypothetical protein
MDIKIRLVKTFLNDRFTISSIEGILEVWNLQSHEEAYLKSVMHIGNWTDRNHRMGGIEDHGRVWRQSFPAYENDLSEADWLVREHQAFIDHMKEFNVLMSYVQPAMREFEQRINHRIGEHMGQLDKIAKQVSELEGVGRTLSALMDQVVIRKRRGKQNTRPKEER